MKYNRRNKKRDANEPEIFEALDALPGCHPIRLDKPVDLLVGYGGRTYLLEVKNPEGKNRLEPDQVKFIDDWPGSPVSVVHNPNEALVAIGHAVSGLAIASRQR